MRTKSIFGRESTPKGSGAYRHGPEDTHTVVCVSLRTLVYNEEVAKTYWYEAFRTRQRRGPSGIVITRDEEGMLRGIRNIKRHVSTDKGERGGAARKHGVCQKRRAGYRDQEGGVADPGHGDARRVGVADGGPVCVSQREEPCQFFLVGQPRL